MLPFPFLFKRGAPLIYIHLYILRFFIGRYFLVLSAAYHKNWLSFALSRGKERTTHSPPRDIADGRTRRLITGRAILPTHITPYLHRRGNSSHHENPGHTSRCSECRSRDCTAQPRRGCSRNWSTGREIHRVAARRVECTYCTREVEHGRGSWWFRWLLDPEMMLERVPTGHRHQGSWDRSEAGPRGWI